MSAIANELATSGLLFGLGEEDLALVDGAAEVVHFDEGAQIFKLGDQADTLYLLSNGILALRLPLTIRGVATEVTLEEKQAGAVIAWSSLVPPHRYTLSAQAVTAVTMVALTRARIEELFAKSSQIQLALMTNLCRVIASRVSLLEARLLRDLQRWVVETYD